jgi:hypothetical protein
VAPRRRRLWDAVLVHISVMTLKRTQADYGRDPDLGGGKSLYEELVGKTFPRPDGSLEHVHCTAAAVSGTQSRDRRHVKKYIT